MDDPKWSLTIAVSERPYPGFPVNGDGWAAHWSGDACRIAVIDGLGHGPDAATASNLARDTLAAHPDLSAGDAIARCHDELTGTRGAAIAIARVSLSSRILTYSAVGNVEAQFWNGQRVQRPIAYRGIVGRALPRPREQEIPLTNPDWMLLLCSDGIRQRFDLESIDEFKQRDAQALADRILHDWGRPTDDAIVLVAMPRPPG